VFSAHNRHGSTSYGPSLFETGTSDVASDKQEPDGAGGETTYTIEDQHGNVVARPSDLAQATRLFWVGFNSYAIMALDPDGTRRVVARKGK
jgi:hypothetical protein